MQRVYDEYPPSIEDMPRALRASACIGGHMTLSLTPESALKMARLIEDGLQRQSAPVPAPVPEVAPERILVVDRDTAPDAAGVWIACIMALLFVAAVSPAASFIAGLL